MSIVALPFSGPANQSEAEAGPGQWQAASGPSMRLAVLPSLVAFLGTIFGTSGAGVSATVSLTFSQMLNVLQKPTGATAPRFTRR